MILVSHLNLETATDSKEPMTKMEYLEKEVAEIKIELRDLKRSKEIEELREELRKLRREDSRRGSGLSARKLMLFVPAISLAVTVLFKLTEMSF
jgi:hypothetical protein